MSEEKTQDKGKDKDELSEDDLESVTGGCESGDIKVVRNAPVGDDGERYDLTLQCNEQGKGWKTIGADKAE